MRAAPEVQTFPCLGKTGAVFHSKLVELVNQKDGSLKNVTSKSVPALYTRRQGLLALEEWFVWRGWWGGLLGQDGQGRPRWVRGHRCTSPACGPQVPPFPLYQLLQWVDHWSVEAVSEVGFSSVPVSLNRPQCTQPRAQARQWGRGECDMGHAQGQREVLSVTGGAKQSCRVLNRKGKSPVPLQEGGTRTPRAQSKAPSQPPKAPQGGIPSCYSPGRAPCRMRAASPRGRPCPPFWGRRAGGTGGIEGTAPADMAGGTPRRTCRGQGT